MCTFDLSFICFLRWGYVRYLEVPRHLEMSRLKLHDKNCKAEPSIYTGPVPGISEWERRKEREEQKWKNRKRTMSLKPSSGTWRQPGLHEALFQKTETKLAECGDSRLYPSTRNWKAESLPHSSELKSEWTHSRVGSGFPYCLSDTRSQILPKLCFLDDSKHVSITSQHRGLISSPQTQGLAGSEAIAG